MSTIHIQAVTRTYRRSIAFDRLRPGLGVVEEQVRSQGRYGDHVDHAYAERVHTQAEREGSWVEQEGPVMALDNVNLIIPGGKTLAVVGPSGSGKSTLLRVVAGLETNFTGRVLYDDQDMADVPPKDRYIGMVFQNYALYPHFAGRGNLAFFFKMHKAPDAEAEERIRVTSEIMGIGFRELLGRKPGTLSGGQQQRIAIARAIVRKPRLFLLDEPLSNLDAKLRTQTRVEIKRLLHRFRITAIYVTHDQMEAIALGDQVAVMCNGRIEQVGTHQELRQSPANAFVAGFLGSPPMNMLVGGTVSDGELHMGDIVVPLPDPVRACVHTGQAVTLGVRPEAACLITHIGNPLPKPGGVCLRGTAEVIEPDFARQTQLVYVRTGALFYAAGGPLDMWFNVGDEVEVVFPTDQLYFFDDASGRRIG